MVYHGFKIFHAYAAHYCYITTYGTLSKLKQHTFQLSSCPVDPVCFVWKNYRISCLWRHLGDVSAPQLSMRCAAHNALRQVAPKYVAYFLSSYALFMRAAIAP